MSKSQKLRSSHSIPSLDSSDGESSLEMRIEQVRSSLVDICVQPEGSDHSVYRFLSRVIFLLQLPVCFAFCKIDGASNVTLLHHRTVNDPLYEEEFSVALRKIGLRSENRRIHSSAIKKFAVSFFGTAYHIIPFSIKARSNGQLRCQDISYEPVPCHSMIGSLLASCFRPFGTALQAVNINAHLAAHLDSLFASSKAEKAPLDAPGKIPLRAEQQSYLDHFKKGIFELLESEIRQFESSPLISPTPHAVPNFLLAVRMFDREDVRFGCYFYNVYFILSEKQKSRIEQALAKVTRTSFVPFGDDETDEWFWACVKRRAFGELLAVMNKPLPAGARTLSEYSLMSGVAIVRVDPFRRGDIGWYEGRFGSSASKEAQEQRRQALRIFVVLHYVLQAMAPDVRQPVVLTLPIGIAGARWATISTVRSGESDPQYPGIVDSKEFQIRYLFYHSLIRPFESRIRRKTKEKYLTLVGWIFARRIQARLRKILSEQQKEENNHRRDLVLSNQDFLSMIRLAHCLCRVYPYAPVHFGPEGVFGEIPEYLSSAIIGEACEVEFGIAAANPFFDRFHFREFLDAEPTGARLRLIINAELGRQNNRVRVIS